MFLALDDISMSEMCNATTRNGKACRRLAVDSSGFCKQHHPSPSERSSTGTNFEHITMKVLRLLGYTVEHNVTKHGCQIDIFAEYRTGIIPIRMMVECKDYGAVRMVGIDEVKKFAGVLQTARGKAVDKGLMVTTNGYTREAKEFAEATGIDVVTFADLSTQLVNFDNYIDRLISEFEASQLFKTYIELSGSDIEDYVAPDNQESKKRLSDYVGKVLFEEDRTKLALLGNFGTGKTTFSRKYAYDLACRYRHDRTARIPILVPLSDYEAKLDIQELVTNTLQFRYGVRIDIALCEELQRLSRFILIFDGFDEMASRVDAETIRDNLREVNKVCRVAENKLILTCRTHFFRDRVQAEILGDFDIVYIPEWGEYELREYLEKRFGNTWQQQLDRINDTHNLAELAQTPLFLEMIVETLPALEAEVSRVELYRAYTNKWVKSQSGRRGARLNETERHQIATELALKLYREDKTSCHFSEFTEMLRRRFDIYDAAQIDYLHADVRTCTFLTRDPVGNYAFRHKSFMEFFVAEHIAVEIKDQCQEHLRVKIFPLEVARFLADIMKSVPPVEQLREWLKVASDVTVRQNVLSLAARLKVAVSDVIVEGDTPSSVDTKLATEFIQGSTEAFDALYTKYKRPLTEYIRRRVGSISIAEELVSDTFVSVLLYRERIENIDNLPAWIFGIGRNKTFDFLRRHSRLDAVGHGEDLVPFEHDDFWVPDFTSVDNLNNAITLRELLDHLPEDERKILTQIIEGRTTSEIAHLLCLRERQVEGVRRRAINRLKTFLVTAGSKGLQTSRKR